MTRRTCETCGELKHKIEGSFQQVCNTPSCVVAMLQLLMSMNGITAVELPDGAE